jgi:hypothetical protein
VQRVCSDRDAKFVVGTMLAAYGLSIIYLGSAAMNNSGWLEQGSLSFELVKGLPAAFVAAVVAGVAAYIAWRQFRVAHAKLNLDLFQQRYELYDVLWRCLSVHATSDHRLVLSEARASLQNVAPKFQFLFGLSMFRFVGVALQQCSAVERLRGSIGIGGDEEARAQFADSRQWILTELDGLRGRFAPFMDFSNWSAPE